MTGLLVSVRDAAEAGLALEAGAALLDVKNPDAGSLGAADPRVLAAVLARAAGRVPVSAALGELADADSTPWRDIVARRPAFVKWGPAGMAGRELGVPDTAGVPVVAVAYADWKRAQAPPPDTIAAAAAARGAPALLIDTWGKDGTTLLDWLDVRMLGRLIARAGVPVALAGSLRLADVPRLRELGPRWLAVRGAACANGDRRAALDPARLATWAGAVPPCPSS